MQLYNKFELLTHTQVHLDVYLTLTVGNLINAKTGV